MIPYRYNIKMDLHNDWREFLRSQFEQYSFLKEEDYIDLPSDEIEVVYFNWISRVIQPAKRKVHYSKEFKCLNTINKGMEKVVKKIQLGQDLIPNQSRLLTDIHFNDNLLFDWGIQHLHLGSKVEENGFVERSNYLLYLFIREQDAYLLQIMDHSSFNKQELVRIIHRNWPELIEKYKIEDVLSIEPKLTDYGVKKFRKYQLNGAIEAEEGIYYLPIGGGLTSAGTSSDATWHILRHRKWINRAQQYVYENMDKYARKATDKLGHIPQEFNFKFVMGTDKQFYVIEENIGIEINIGKLQ